MAHKGSMKAQLAELREPCSRANADTEVPLSACASTTTRASAALHLLFFGSNNGGDRAAIIYTLLRCCRLAEVGPVAYLRDTLAALARKIRRLDVPEMMPATWKLRRDSG